MTSLCPEHGLDRHDGLLDVDVLPDPDDGPLVVGEGLIDSAVTLDVGRKLRFPVVGVRPGDLLVFRAAVPEAAVHEDGDTPPGEHDVGPDAHRTDPQQVVLPVPVTAVVERRPEPNLGFRTGPSIRLPDLGGSFVPRLRVRHDPPTAEVHRAAPLGPCRVLVGLVGLTVDCHRAWVY